MEKARPDTKPQISEILDDTLSAYLLVRGKRTNPEFNGIL
jgi:hypothetical protein